MSYCVECGIWSEQILISQKVNKYTRNILNSIFSIRIWLVLIRPLFKFLSFLSSIHLGRVRNISNRYVQTCSFIVRKSVVHQIKSEFRTFANFVIFFLVFFISSWSEQPRDLIMANLQLKSLKLMFIAHQNQRALLICSRTAIILIFFHSERKKI